MERNFSDNYWALLPSDQLVSELESKVMDFDKQIDVMGRWISWRDLYYNYYLVTQESYQFPSYGVDNYKRLNINHFRAILKHLLSLVTSQRVAPEPIAVNSDYKSQAQVDFCRNILTYVEKEKNLEDIFEQATETAIVMGAAYVAREWDATLGDAYGVDPMSQQIQRKGDIVVSLYNPIDCIFDFASSSWEDTNWVILRRYFNRWDLISRFPLFADQIKSMSVAAEVKRHRLGHILNEKNDDLIPLYTFYHKKTASMPDGRATLFLDSNTCLFDGGLPYKRVPVTRIAADKQINSPFPYSISMDLLPIQKVYNALCSTICTNQAAFGVQNILVPRSSAIAVAQLSEGLNAITYDPDITHGAKPEPLSLLSTKQEVFNWIEYLEQKMAQISGVNETIQGNPEANLKSGTALAFVASQALTFISPLSRSYNSLLEDTWTGVVDILKEFATTPRMLLISGLNNKAEAKAFTNKDIAEIDRVTVEAGNPLLNTLAGRLQVAQDLVQGGLINKEEYITVLRTGQIEPLYEYEKSELLCIKANMEALQAGRPVKALKTDNHPLFIREYLSILATPDARNAPNNPVMENTLSAINQHMQLWQQVTQQEPAILAIQNIPPFPSPAPSGPPPPKVSESISFKDLPPEGQVQMAKQAGIDLTGGQGAALMPAGPQPPHLAPQGANTGRENPNGAKKPGAPNLPGLAQNTPPGSAPAVHQPGMPPLPKGSPASTQAGFAALQNTMPQHPPMPQ